MHKHASGAEIQTHMGLESKAQTHIKTIHIFKSHYKHYVYFTELVHEYCDSTRLKKTSVSLW